MGAQDNRLRNVYAMVCSAGIIAEKLTERLEKYVGNHPSAVSSLGLVQRARPSVLLLSST